MQTDSNKYTNSNLVPSEKHKRRRFTEHFRISGECFKIDCLITYMHSNVYTRSYIADAWMCIHIDHWDVDVDCGYSKTKGDEKFTFDWFSPHMIDWLIFLCHLSGSVVVKFGLCLIIKFIYFIFLLIFCVLQLLKHKIELKLNKMRRKKYVSVQMQLNCGNMNAECIWWCICSSKKDHLSSF